MVNRPLLGTAELVRDENQTDVQSSLGWSEPVTENPNEVTKIRMKFDKPGRYVWHCHILSHEDHEMMRPIYVTPK